MMREGGLIKETKKERMEINAEIHQLEVFIPESLYDLKTQALRVTLGCELSMKTSSETFEIYKRDKLKTLIDKEPKKSDSYILLNLSQLEIFFEQ
jgi:hypothetical protein